MISKGLIVAAVVLQFQALPDRAALAADLSSPKVGDLQPGENAEAIFQASAYDIVHTGKTNQVNEPGSSWRPVRGRVYRLSVEHDVFFASVGRMDLRDQFSSRRALGTTLNVSGYLIAIAGVIVTPWMLYEGRGIGALAGVVMMVGGVSLRWVGEDLKKPTVPEDQAIEMAARYNQELRVRLQLPPETASQAAPIAYPARNPDSRRKAPGLIVLAPMPAGGGACVALMGQLW